jgi:hypothetical protein
MQRDNSAHVASVHTSLAVLASLLVAFGATFSGCGSSSGGQVTGASTSNLTIENATGKSLHVFVSGGEVGEVLPGATARFFIDPGFREVEFRERGDSLRDSQGFYDFTTSDTLRLVHDPSVGFNLRVINQRGDSVEVIVGAREYGKALPLQTQTFKIDTGRRDLFFRRTGTSTADYFGTFNFNTTDVVEVTYN